MTTAKSNAGRPSKPSAVERRPNEVALARRAADGDEAARRQVNHLVHPIITYQTHRFCRRFCHGNHYRYRCTLPASPASPKRIPRAPGDAHLCACGNASYLWMLDDLTHAERLRRFEGRHGAGIYDYVYRIANSLPFYERWKDWRFGRRAYVPTYIRDLDPMAARIFLALRDHEAVADIARRLNLAEERAENLCQAVVAALTRRNRLYLLDPPTSVSLSGSADGEGGAMSTGGKERELPYTDESPEQRDAKRRLQAAWQQLTAVEQFVLEAMLIDEEDAGHVLGALKQLGLQIKKGVAPAETNRQQLYYFRRKAFDKLRRLMGNAAQ